MKRFIKWLMDENPLFILCLGLCPALAVTTTLESGYLMGLCVLIVLLLSNLTISLISKFVSDQIRVPVYIMIIATFVTILDMFLQSYVEPLSKVLGIYIPLIVVNCIILGRALSFASKNNVKKSIIDAFKIGFGYTLSLAILGFVRELLGSNTITIMDRVSNLTGYVIKYEVFPANEFIPNGIFVSPAGAFLTMGLILGIINAIRKEDVK